MAKPARHKTGQTDVSGRRREDPPATRKVEVFRPGTFRAMNGRDYSFSADDVSAIAAGYDATKAPAPVVVGHPKHDDPAFGWARGFAVNEAGTLVAELDDLAPEFVSAVEEGRYRKVSMRFFAPDAPNNPNPGSYYPRHIGFLGGAAPAVSGLAPVQFAEADEDELVEIAFVEPALEDVATIFRRLREFIIEKFSRDEADNAVPEYLIRWVDDAADAAGEPAVDEPSTTSGPGFSGGSARRFTVPARKEDPMSGSSKDGDAALKTREADLDKRERALAHAENVSFAEDLVDRNRLLPARKDAVVALLDELATHTDSEIAFSDDGKEKKLSPIELFRDILSAQPEAVPKGKTDLGDDNPAAAPAFAAPDGLGVDSDGLETHGKALAWQKQHPGTDYLDAVRAVEEG